MGKMGLVVASLQGQSLHEERGWGCGDRGVALFPPLILSQGQRNLGAACPLGDLS